MDDIAKGLCHGRFSSLIISFNEDHAANYKTAEDWSDQYDVDDFPGGEEDRAEALGNNTVWTAQWYPHTQTGFHIIHASSYEKLAGFLRAEVSTSRPSAHHTRPTTADKEPL